MEIGVFINETEVGKMVNIRNQAKELDGSEVSEREIVKQTLGKRIGYEKGLGYGFVPSKCIKRSTCESSQLEALKEELSITEEELQDATSSIKSQQKMINN
ncbi:hypothetical protein BUALT_Bualt13G0124400 [Buddleja alternifolia]|uniref:Uncharacterized protein n=1 Tax=Buddleja alternifolia TaxID=168488 RepID=A0AAV6WL54_9LAMI|nr:hypothetical protein BUALT_Bualt13G0124400 [Buddleja alternifolia]